MEEKAEISAEKQRVIGRPFQPGQSGNPKGKPKGTISITQEIKKQLRKRDPETRRTWLEIFVRRSMVKAIKDQDPQMIKLIWNYVDGMPLQRTELSGNVDAPITINMIPASTLKQDDSDTE